jgi:hypothetical protein
MRKSLGNDPQPSLGTTPMSNLAPAPLVMCNWSTFNGSKKVISFQITKVLKNSFVEKFGTRFMTFALNAMMEHYVTTPQALFDLIDEYVGTIYENSDNVSCFRKNAIMFMYDNIASSIQHEDNSTTFTGNVAKKLHEQFEILAHSYLNHFHSIGRMEIELDDIYNMAIFHAMDHIKIN